MGRGDDSIFIEEGRIIWPEEMDKINSELERDIKIDEFFERHSFLKKIRDKYEYFKLSGDFRLAIKYNS